MTRVWVVDTSSLLFIKRYLKRESHRKYLNYLMTQSEWLYCPPQVIQELLAVGNEDVFTEWAKKNKATLARLGPCADKMREAMANKAVASCIDHRRKHNDRDPADPWVIATALKLRDQGYWVTVVTNERDRYRGARASLNVAAGSMGFPAINMESLLRDTFRWWNESDFSNAS